MKPKRRPSPSAARWAGGILGLAAALVLLVVARPGAAGSPLPGSVRFGLAPRGELEARPAPPRPVLVADSLRPGGAGASGAFQLRDQSGDALSVALRARPDSTAFDGLLRVRLSRGEAILADTTLQGLAAEPARLRLGAGETARLRLHVWLPGDVLSGYEGHLVHVVLVPDLRPIGGGK